MKEIFVVEDDPGIREMIGFMLSKEHYKVRCFAGAESFKKGIKNEKPNLILLDIMLPDGNGLEICTELTQNPETASIPVILMSAHADTIIPKDVGARDHIAKPFNIKDFLQKIDKVLQ